MKRIWIMAGGACLVVLALIIIFRDRAPATIGSPATGIVVTGATGRTATAPIAAASLAPSPAAATPMPAQAPVASEGAAPPLPAGLEGGFDPLAFAKSIRTEKRDAEWAPTAEAGLRSTIARVPYMGPQAEAMSVYCAATRCEVTGKMPSRLSMENTAVAMDGLQGERMNEMLGAMNQEMHGASFSQDSFTIWTMRKPMR